MEVSQAFVGEAGAALESSDVGQSGKVIVQPLSSCGLHVQCAAAVAGSVGLYTHTHTHVSCDANITCNTAADPQYKNGSSRMWVHQSWVVAKQRINKKTPPRHHYWMIIPIFLLLHLVSLCVRSTRDTGFHADGLISPDDGVRRAALTHSCLVDHVVSRRAGDTGGAVLGQIEGTAATLRSHTSDHVGDVDGVDLRKVTAVFSPLRGNKDG